MGVNTGTNRSRGGLLVQDNNTATPEDTVFAYGVREIIVTTGTLVNNGQGTVTITTGGGGGGGSGTVTSITNAADSGTGTAITTSGTFTYTGGTNITTAVSGTTVTINSDSASTVAAGVANEVAFYTGANALGGSTKFTWDDTVGAERLTISGGSAADMVRVISTDTSTGTAPDIAFVRDRTYLAGLDLGVILFKGPDATDAEHTYCYITADAKDGTVGAEKGQLDFRISNGSGGYDYPLRLSDTGAWFNVTNDSVVNVRMDTGSTDEAFKLDGGTDTLTLNVPMTINQQTTGTAGLTINIDDNGATASPDIKLLHNSTSPAANDDLGHIHFQGKNSAAATLSYTDIYADILDPTDTVEAGRFNFRVRTATNGGALTDMFVIRGDNNPCVVVNDSSRSDVDFRVETNSQTSAFFMDASADTATFNVPLTINTYTLPTADGNAGEVITTDGAGTLTFAAAGSGSPAGANTEIQFNNAGAFGASSRLTFNNGTNTLTVGSAFTNTPVLFSQSAADNAIPTEGGNITSNLTTVSMEINTGIALGQEIGMKQTTTAYQVETGKTTTQSFGQTQKTVLTASGTPYACYPSEGGLIVVNDAGGAGAFTLNLVLGSNGGSYASNANPPNAAGGGTAVGGVPDKAGYGTWQIGDQVTVLAANESGNVPAISIISTTLTTNGSGGSGDPVLDAGSAAKINGVNSFTSPNTITTNYTAKTYILMASVGGIFGAEWVAIG